MVTLHTETVDQVLPEIMPLLMKHYAEIAWRKDKIQFEPDIEKYRAFEKSGILRIFTARKDEALVGYATFFITQNPHYKSLKQALNDIFYVEPSRRGAMIGTRLMHFAREELKACGVQAISLHIKTSHNWQALAERWGFEHTEINMQQWIGD